MKIAIIGAGIFGTVMADLLSEVGHRVTILEKQQDVFLGASGNSSNRLHLGFHYPRDLETAVQSLEGFKKFVASYSRACNFEFPCIYAISESNSKTSIDSFLTFLDLAQLKAVEFDKNFLTTYGFNTKSISRSWRTSEGVVDIDVLRKILTTRLRQKGVRVALGIEIRRISAHQKKWKLEFERGEEEFDFVVIATYGVDKIEIPDVKLQRSKSVYQATLILQAKLSIPKLGITVVDGDFITVLPKGFTDKSLVYAPGPSVIAESESFDGLIAETNSPASLESNSLRLKERFRYYFPETLTEFSNQPLVAIRNIEMSTRETDKRVSRLEKLAPNLVSVRSGKLDHAILIGEELVRQTS